MGQFLLQLLSCFVVLSQETQLLQDLDSLIIGEVRTLFFLLFSLDFDLLLISFFFSLDFLSFLFLHSFFPNWCISNRLDHLSEVPLELLDDIFVALLILELFLLRLVPDLVQLLLLFLAAFFPLLGVFIEALLQRDFSLRLLFRGRNTVFGFILELFLLVHVIESLIGGFVLPVCHFLFNDFLDLANPRLR